MEIDLYPISLTCSVIRSVSGSFDGFSIRERHITMLDKSNSISIKVSSKESFNYVMQKYDDIYDHLCLSKQIVVEDGARTGEKISTKKSKKKLYMFHLWSISSYFKMPSYEFSKEIYL